MTPEECRDRAEHCREAKERATDDFTRRYLAAMEHSYRVLAESEGGRSSRSLKMMPTTTTEWPHPPQAGRPTSWQSTLVI